LQRGLQRPQLIELVGKLVAPPIVGGTGGVYVEHPLFVSLPTDGSLVPDPIDRYFAEKDNVAGGKTQLIAGGGAIFVTFKPTDQLEIHFKVASAYKPDSTPPASGGGGCNQLTKFMSVATQFAPCAACHAGTSNPSATASMLIDGYNAATGTPQVATACAQILSRVNLTTTEQSSIYVEPDPSMNSNHQFHFGNATMFQAYKTAVDTWVQAEKTSPQGAPSVGMSTEKFLRHPPAHFRRCQGLSGRQSECALPAPTGLHLRSDAAIARRHGGRSRCPGAAHDLWHRPPVAA